MLHKNYPTAFVDLETTGSRADLHRITEIAIVHVTPDGELSEWSSLVNPGREIPLQISALTGINDAMVADAPHFEDIWREVWERLDGPVFVAHNVHFDYGFLRRAFDALGRRFRPPRLCTVRLSRTLFPHERGHSLDALVRRFNLTCEPRHRALTDARAVWEWCGKVRQLLGAEAVAAAVADQLDGPALPAHLDRARIDALTEGPGVYLFKGADDALLYVGKSVNLRRRVLAHLAGAARGAGGQKMITQVRDVDTIETAGELGALLLEASLIKRESPLFNRRLRRHAEVFTLSLTEDGAGYLSPRVVTLDVNQDAAASYGLFRHKALARKRLRTLADDHGLCRKKLLLEHGPGSCFAYQLKRCRGACVGGEAAVAHNLRLLEALGSERLEPWPYAGPVAIAERHAGRVAWHVFDRWCLLGSVALRRDLPDLLENPPKFDLDLYRIVRRFLNQTRHHRDIEVL